MTNGISAANRSQGYGNLQRAGRLQNGRIVYRVIDSSGNEAGKVSVPQEQADTFEKAYKDILSTAPKIREFAEKNSAPDSVKKQKSIALGCIIGGLAAGAGIPAYLTRNSKLWKKVVSISLGSIGGFIAGMLGGIKLVTPPWAGKVAQAGNTISQLDVQPIIDTQV